MHESANITWGVCGTPSDLVARLLESYGVELFSPVEKSGYGSFFLHNFFGVIIFGLESVTQHECLFQRNVLFFACWTFFYAAYTTDVLWFLSFYLISGANCFYYFCVLICKELKMTSNQYLRNIHFLRNTPFVDIQWHYFWYHYNLVIMVSYHLLCSFLLLAKYFVFKIIFLVYVQLVFAAVCSLDLLLM